MAAAVISINANSSGGKGNTGEKLGMDIGKTYLRVIGEAFRRLDEYGHGFLTQIQLQYLWRTVLPGLAENDLLRLSDEIYQDLDPNQDGHVSWPEVETYFLGDQNGTTDVDKMITETVVQKAPTVREIMWNTLEVDAPRFADEKPWMVLLKQVAQFISNVAILVSIINFIVESLPSNYDGSGNEGSEASFAVEAVCIAVFTVEFILRFISTPSQKDFWVSFFTWVDVLAIFPFYLGVALGSNPSGGLVVLRVLRLLRLLRMLKLGRQFEAVQVLVIAVGRTIGPLLVSMVGVNTVAVTLFGSLIVSAERYQAHFDVPSGKWMRNDDSEYLDAGTAIDFQSIPVSMWWAWVTLTTVGYGDMYPRTGPGQLVASVTMCCGLVLMAFPLTLLASAFAETTEELTQKKRMRARADNFRNMLRAHGLSPNADSDTIAASVMRARRPQTYGIPSTTTPMVDGEEGDLGWFNPKFRNPERLLQRTPSGLGIAVPPLAQSTASGYPGNPNSPPTNPIPEYSTDGVRNGRERQSATWQPVGIGAAPPFSPRGAGSPRAFGGGSQGFMGMGGTGGLPPALDMRLQRQDQQMAEMMHRIRELTDCVGRMARRQSYDVENVHLGGNLGDDIAYARANSCGTHSLADSARKPSMHSAGPGIGKDSPRSLDPTAHKKTPVSPPGYNSGVFRNSPTPKAGTPTAGTPKAGTLTAGTPKAGTPRNTPLLPGVSKSPDLDAPCSVPPALIPMPTAKAGRTPPEPVLV
eukprot:Hpha_TRINITY_DN13248_c0_g1::TRINITY_DN13248_c0_g1_i1::g.154532::m.154532/K04886/KCNB2; potassium voltage-gated channel Shab-related subfamily B member 2